jgi:hypothetical protein
LGQFKADLMGGSHSTSRRASVQDFNLGDVVREAPPPAAALPLPITKVSTGPAVPVPSAPQTTPPRTTPHSENEEFRRSGLLPTRDSNLQREERRMFLWIFIGMLLSFAGLLTVILVSRM